MADVLQFRRPAPPSAPKQDQAEEQSTVSIPGGRVWSCRCGHQLFYITPDGCVCSDCGDYQRFPT